MKSITYIEQALAELDKEVEATLLNIKLSLKEKDNVMLPMLLQKKSFETNIRRFDLS